MKKSKLLTLIVSELKALAKKKKVVLPVGAKKAEIVEALSAAFKRNDKKTAKTAAVKKTSRRRKTIARKRAPAEKPAQAPAAAPAREWKLPPGAEEPLMAQERVSEAKYYTGPAQEHHPGPPYQDLPHGYGEETIALMVRDPYLVHAYWEVTPARIEREKAWFGWNSKLAVRIYDVTGIQFDGRNALGYFDQEVSERLGSWYFDVGRPSHSFLADVGLLSPEGKFLTVARSNYISMPRDGVSGVLDEEWMLADEEFWKLYGFPGGPSSPQIQEMIKRRRMQQITSPGTFSRAKRK
ncbi:MAG TPA: DUF4912 domain-containing protein [Nitrospirota bacterium]|nr:DUF4912 domain-containing protein [Nitrospirota bacterium]